MPIAIAENINVVIEKNNSIIFPPFNVLNPYLLYHKIILFSTTKISVFCKTSCIYSAFMV